MKFHRAGYALLGLLLLCTGGCREEQSGTFEPNYDETRVPDFTLPDPLTLADGTPVRDAETWQNVRRPELLETFADAVYGHMPDTPYEMTYTVIAGDTSALDGTAVRKQVRLTFRTDNGDLDADLLVFVPKRAVRPVPAFLGLNFSGNHTVHPDTGIAVTEGWVRNSEARGITDNRASEADRGAGASRWPVERMIERGYALATMYYGDLDPDFDDGFQNGLHPLFYEPGQTTPAEHEWGSIGAWAWGLSRALDYLEEDGDIDGTNVAVIGHSRLGKTSLWAGACDTRFALVISNDSGCGGAALSRRRYGETVGRINTAFPHWFADAFNRYSNNEDALPVDQHELLALIAPRPLYVASAEEDRWADPRGEYLAAYYASPVYELLGKTGIPTPEMPNVNEPVMTSIGYHIRSGGHDVTLYDWERYMDFFDLHRQ